jgi:hypothetical protein
MDEFPRTLYKHQNPLTTTVHTQDEQDKYLADGWSLQARPQEQIDQEQYLKDHTEELKKGEPDHDADPAEEKAKEDKAADHSFKADIVKQEGVD